MILHGLEVDQTLSPAELVPSPEGLFLMLVISLAEVKPKKLLPFGY